MTDEESVVPPAPIRESSALLPIVIGITGHRDISDIDAAEIHVRQVVREIETAYPHSPLVVMTPLADGADRILAHVGLSLDLQVLAPLPLPLDEYCNDFSAASVAEFNEILRHPNVEHYVLPYAPFCNETNTQDHGYWRNLQYVQVGVHVAKRSHILLALWDGKNNGKAGGTSQIVFFRRHGYLHEEPGTDIDPTTPDPLLRSYQVETPDNGIMCIVPVQRQSNAADDTYSTQGLGEPVWEPRHVRHATSAKRTKDQGDVERDYMELQQLDKYNELANTYLHEVSMEALLEHAPIPGASFQDLLRQNVASSLASKVVPQTRRVLLTAFCLTWAMVVSFVLFGIKLSLAWLGAYLVFLLSTAVVIVWSNYGSKYSEALDIRALAEALRVQLYWNIAGVQESVSDHYLYRHRQATGWIRKGLIGSAVLAQRETTHEEWISIYERWIQGQASYYQRRVRKNQRTVINGNFVANVLFGCGLLLITTVFTLAITGLAHLLSSPLQLPLITLMAALPASSGLLKGYLEATGYREDIETYRYMEQLFERASEEFDHALRHAAGKLPAKRAAELREIVRKLGIEALRETSEWNTTHKAKMPKMPTG
jgi:hypothetical protein